DRLIVRIATSIPSAFSAGALHQTTQWCLEMLEKYYHGGRLLDVGTGAGLLALCAARLAIADKLSAQIEAFDIYQDAVKQARLNLRFNSLSSYVKLHQAELSDYPEQAYDFVI